MRLQRLIKYLHADFKLPTSDALVQSEISRINKLYDDVSSKTPTPTW